MHSPGLVEDAESLARILMPEHIDASTRTLKPAAFQLRDLMSRGLSMIRTRHAPPDEIVQRGARLFARRTDTFRDVAVVLACSIRKVRDDGGRQAFCVIDDALSDFRAHASAKRSQDASEGICRKLRGELIELFAVVIASEAHARGAELSVPFQQNPS